MNTIYKVVWSRAKHCYVVASELAKSCTKSAQGKRRAAVRTVTALTLVGLLGGMGVAQAANGSATAKEGVYQILNGTYNLTAGSQAGSKLYLTNDYAFLKLGTGNYINLSANGVTIKGDTHLQNGLTVNDSVTAQSYKVGDKTYIDANGINANSQKITNVAAGDISTASTDAVNGSQLYSERTARETADSNL